MTSVLVLNCFGLSEGVQWTDAEQKLIAACPDDFQRQGKKEDPSQIHVNRTAKEKQQHYSLSFATCDSKVAACKLCGLPFAGRKFGPDWRWPEKKCAGAPDKKSAEGYGTGEQELLRRRDEKYRAHNQEVWGSASKHVCFMVDVDKLHTLQ